MRDKIVWGTTLELQAFYDIVRLNIVLFNSLNSEECFSSTNNLSNIASISMLVTNSDQYFDLKLKDSEELILNSRLIKEVKFREPSFAL